jgi:Flp pilus assembly pilin Flp
MIRTIGSTRRLGGIRQATSGGVAIEYAIIGAVIGLGIVAALMSTRQSMRSRYDLITYGVAQASNSITTGKTVASTSDGGTYLDNGRPVSRTWIKYTDGTSDLVVSGSWFQKGVSSFDANGYQTSGLWVDANGNRTEATYTYLTDTSQMIQQTGSGSCNCTYRSAWNYDPQPDGSRNVIYHNTLVDGTNSETWMYQSQTSVYNSTPNSWTYIGDVQTMRDGTVVTNGSSIAKYL